MNIFNLPPEEVFDALLTSPRGLSESEARQRLHEYGLNEITAAKRMPLLRRLLSQFTHFLAVLLWIAAGLCLLSELLRPGEGMGTLGLAIVGVIVVNAVFTFVQEYRAERAVEVLERLLPFNVTVVREGVLRELPAREVAPGDIISLAEGDKVPADARLVEEHRLFVNNAPLTGESELKPRSSAAFEGDVLESPNIVFAGTLVVSGSGRAAVYATGMASEFGKIAHLTSGVEPEPSPLQQETVRVTRLIAALSMAAGILFFLIGMVTERDFWHSALFAIGIIVANVPEGLLPTVTLSLAMGSQRMARRKALVKTLTAVETLGSVTVICTDKTGTLTRNRMEVRRLWAPGGEAMLLSAAALANNAVYENGRYRGDPMEAALLKRSRETIGDCAAQRVREIPFDAERKRMTTVHLREGGVTVSTKGAFETVLPLCSALGVAGEVLALDGDRRQDAAEAAHGLMDEGLRVIAVAYKEQKGVGGTAASVERLSDGELESGMTFAGLIGLEDPLRPEVPSALERCRTAGIRVIMITGDAGRTARAVARQAGFAAEAPTVIEGPSLAALSDGELRRLLAAGQELLFARMTPGLKMRVVGALKDVGERVAVTGDGVNDAPALKRADIGVAMGVTGTDAAREAADIILLDDNFATIVGAVEEGRAVFENIRKFVSYIFASNIPEIVPYVAYALFSIPLPLTILQILAIDLGTDMFPALALGAERPSHDIMKRPPRPPGERLLSFGLLGRASLFLGPLEAVAGLFGFFSVLFGGGWRWGEALPPTNLLYLQATTACFAGIVAAQIGNVFACRSFRESVVTLGVFSNRLILLGVALEVLLSALIIYTPAGNRLFGTAPLDARILLLLLPFGLLLLLAEEARKYYVRRAPGAPNR